MGPTECPQDWARMGEAKMAKTWKKTLQGFTNLDIAFQDMTVHVSCPQPWERGGGEEEGG